MFTIVDYSSALEYSIIRRYTNIVYYYYYYKISMIRFLVISIFLYACETTDLQRVIQEVEMRCYQAHHKRGGRQQDHACNLPIKRLDYNCQKKET